MKSKRALQKFAVLALSGAMSFSAFALPVAAETSANRISNNTGVNDALDAFDIIDESEKGSIEIYKYDQTSAKNDGVWSDNGDGSVTVTGTDGKKYTVESTGEENKTAQDALADYAIKGVEFSYVRLGDVETYSYTNSGKSEINVVYEVDKDFADILGLKASDAYDMTAKGVAFTCNSGKLHYDSKQLNDALAALISGGDTAAKNKLEAYAKSHLTGRFADTNASGYTSASNLELGLYLIVETEVPEEVTVTTAPWLISLPFTNISDSDQTAQDKDTATTGERWIYDAVCYPKNQTGNPTLDKMVRNAYGTLNPSSGLVSYSTDYVVSTYDVPTGASTASEFVTERSQNEKTDEYAFGDTTTASEGDMLDYIVVSKLPTITSASTYLTQYTFEDTLSEGLTYNKDARIAIYNNEYDANVNNIKNAVVAMDLDSASTMLSNQSGAYTDKAPVTTWLYSQNYANMSVTGPGSDLKKGETILTVRFTNDGLKMINEGIAQSADVKDYGDYAFTDGNGNVVLNKDGFSEYYIVLYYTVTVNSDAQVVLGDNGNPNDVNLTWERTSQDYTNTLEDRCYVYSYGIDLTKYFSDDEGDYSNVQFILYNVTDGYYVVADTIDDTEGENIYYVGGSGDIADTEIGKTADRENATVFVPNDDGKIFIHGLEADTYELIEIATDDGYKLLAGPVTININTTTRQVVPAVAGYVGNDAADGAHVHASACYDADGYLICGHAADEDANGRTIGKTAMYVGQSGTDFVYATATVDETATAMNAYGESDNASVGLEVMNTPTFIFPPTGGYGTIVFTVAGCAAAFAGIMVATKKKKGTDEQ
ncbi:MAG TPA: hypothetical protein IAB17_00500 [Candidatus Alectryocaccobium stercorigallinarum]|nr:hypothetical protein [Candidatus Alectryocaccobium stercorigallinarum]